MAGALTIAAAAEAGMWAILAITVGAGLAACMWLATAARRSTASREREDRPALSGEFGIVRNWSNGDGEVVAAGALWRAHRIVASEDDDDAAIHAGDAVVVERVSGATLTVRPAADSEGPW